MHKRMTALLAAVAAGLTLSAGTASAQSKEKFNLALNWFAVGDHAAYWVALDKGYYAKHGLDVSIEASKGSGDSIAKVDTGRADVGLADTVPITAAISRGAQVKVVGMVFDKSPMTFFTLKDKTLKQPKDIEGKTVGAPPGDSQRQAFPAFAGRNHIDVSKVTWINIDPTAKVAALAGKRVDAVVDYTTGLPFYDKALGAGQVSMLQWADFGFDLYSMSIMASDKTIKERPAALKAFLQASYEGWQDVMKDPKAALAIYKKHVPEIDTGIIAANMQMGFKLMQTQRYADHGLGWIDHAKMCDTVEFVNKNMDLPKPVACNAVYTSAFLPKVTMPLPVLK